MSRLKNETQVDPTRTYDERMKRFWHYMENKEMNEEWIETAPGELRIIVEALADYRDIVMEKTEEMTGYKKAVWENRAETLQKIQTKIEQSIGYNRDEQLEKCKKKKISNNIDIGEDALTLIVNKKMK